MMKTNKPLIRRTFRQERFDILIKKQRNGTANFNDLTELDDIVNRDPDIRESILEEMHGQNEPGEGLKIEPVTLAPAPPPGNWLTRIKELFARMFISETAFFNIA